MSEQTREYVVGEDSAGVRLDRWLTDELASDEELELVEDVSRNQVQEWIVQGIVVGPRSRVKASDSVSHGEIYRVTIPAYTPPVLTPTPMELNIVFDDEQVVVVDKPRGLVVHPAPGHEDDTLINGLLAKGMQLSGLGGEWRPGVVHRIDKDTSGLVVFAKTDSAYHRLREQFEEHSVERTYLAIVHGVMKHESGTVDAPIGRDRTNRQRMAVVKNGKRAVTHFRVLEELSGYTYVELKLETGRTHQIRVHMAYIGYPLAGDPVYGPRRTLSLAGQALHATSLGFVHPESEQELSFTSDVPSDMKQALESLRTEGG